MRSLNTGLRRQQIEEIEVANSKMYNRLIKQKASISFRDN